jgi:hypothetical protein
MFSKKYITYKTLSTHDVESYETNHDEITTSKSNNKWKYTLLVFVSTAILVYFSFGWWTKLISGASTGIKILSKYNINQFAF